MQFLLSTIVFIFLLFFLWDLKLPMQMAIKESWLWNKQGAFGTSIPTSGENPLKVLNGYKISEKYYSFATGKFSEYLEPNKIDFALLTRGYIEYQKIGDEVNFFSERGELFWKKPINSYPRSGYFGTPVLYLAGDNNTVFLLDISGNPLGLGELNGRFLTDYDFDQTGKGAVVLFSGGELYRVDEKGNLIYSKDLSEERTNSFFKSVSLAPNGIDMVVHFSLNQIDYLMILDSNGKIKEEWELGKFYPHKIYMSLGNDEKLLINVPDKVLFYDSNELVWEEEKIKPGPIYESVFAFNAGYVYGVDKEIIFLDTEGKKLKTKVLGSGEFPIRFFPSKEHDKFYLETKNDIYQFTWFR